MQVVTMLGLQRRNTLETPPGTSGESGRYSPGANSKSSRQRRGPGVRLSHTAAPETPAISSSSPLPGHRRSGRGRQPRPLSHAGRARGLAPAPVGRGRTAARAPPCARAPAGSGPCLSRARAAGLVPARARGGAFPRLALVPPPRAPPCAPKLPAREPISARPGGCHFLVGGAARPRPLRGPWGGAERSAARSDSLRPRVRQPRVGAGPRRHPAASQTERNFRAPRVPAGWAIGRLFVPGLHE